MGDSSAASGKPSSLFSQGSSHTITPIRKIMMGLIIGASRITSKTVQDMEDALSFAMRWPHFVVDLETAARNIALCRPGNQCLWCW